MSTERVAVILAGGRSQRFGSNKAHARLGTLTFLQRLDSLLKSAGFRVIVDDSPGEGPLFAIFHQLKKVWCRRLLVTACDMPLLQSDVLEMLWKKGERADLAVLTCQGRKFPLPGIYAKNLLPHLEYLIAAGRRDLKSLWECPIITHVLPFSHWCTVDPKGASLININTPEDYHEHALRAGRKH